MSKYLKLLAVVEEDYEPIAGKVTVIDGMWMCENVMGIKLNDDFAPADPETLWRGLKDFLESALELGKERSNE